MSNEFKDLMNDFTEEQKANYELCMKYPILIPHNDEEFQYEYTQLDFFPPGWKLAFGELWAQDVQDAINKMYPSMQKDACILDIKEKWGRLSVLFNVYSSELSAVSRKYEDLSERICSRCGKLKSKKFSGWVTLLCDSCTKEIERR